MPVTAVVGANWGDEGKGKIADFLAQKSDIVVRFQGGNNAGHTIINEYGKFALHLLPSGVFNPKAINILGPGVAVNIPFFLKELDDLVKRGVPQPRIYISERAQIVLPYHIAFDELEEKRLADEKFGSTKTGIAPFYGDKYLKIGIQINEIFDEERLHKRFENIIAQKNVILEHLYNVTKITPDKLIETIIKDRDRIKPFIADTTSMLYAALKDKKKILLEGQLGALRDPDHGIYPYSTSSSPLAGFACIGAGIPPYEITRIVAVTKAYSSCVGAGPFATELFGQEGETLRAKGGSAGEYGATTGRPRRVGWFDAVATPYGCRLQGATEIALSNIDVLGYLDHIKVCVEYNINGKRTRDFPLTKELDKVEPVFKKLPGWKCDISKIRTFSELPTNTKQYIRFLEGQLSVPIKLISVGPERGAMIKR